MRVQQNGMAWNHNNAKLMKYLIALLTTLPVFAALGVESTSTKAELEASEVKTTATDDVAGRLQRNGDGWFLKECDREKLSITVTNKFGEVWVNPKVHKITSDGLLVEHDSALAKVKWPGLPTELAMKYRAILASAEAKDRAKILKTENSPPNDAQISSPGSIAADSSGKTVHVRGYTRKDGAYVAPYTRQPPSKK